MANKNEKKLKDLLNELKEILRYVNSEYDLNNLDDALNRRNAYLGRLTYLGAQIEEHYYQEKAKMLDENPKTAIGKLEIRLEVTDVGRLYRIKKQIYETIVIQCRNISSLMIEIQSERKHSR
jgi:hypothetical protein